MWHVLASYAEGLGTRIYTDDFVIWFEYAHDWPLRGSLSLEFKFKFKLSTCPDKVGGFVVFLVLRGGDE